MAEDREAGSGWEATPHPNEGRGGLVHRRHGLLLPAASAQQRFREPGFYSEGPGAHRRGEYDLAQHPGAPVKLLASPHSRRYHLPLMNDVAQRLSALAHGDPHAASRLLPVVYDELRKLAAQRMVQEQPSSVRLGLEDRQ